jgi:hypothetical protein
MDGDRGVKIVVVEGNRWDNGTRNDTSGCNGRSGNRRHNDGDVAISATGVAGIGSE